MRRCRNCHHTPDQHCGNKSNSCGNRRRVGVIRLHRHLLSLRAAERLPFVVGRASQRMQQGAVRRKAESMLCTSTEALFPRENGVDATNKNNCSFRMNCRQRCRWSLRRAERRALSRSAGARSPVADMRMTDAYGSQTKLPTTGKGGSCRFLASGVAHRTTLPVRAGASRGNRRITRRPAPIFPPKALCYAM